MDPLFGFTIYEMQVCHVIIPYLELHKGFIFSREEPKANTALVRKPYTLSYLRESFEELSLDFKNLFKRTPPDGLLIYE
jgi:hypothetical protein